MLKAFLNKLKESFTSVAPVSLIVLMLGLILGVESSTIWNFVLCFVFLVFGLALFTKGADTAMFSMGESIGSKLSKSKKIWLILLAGGAIGLIVTFAEPELGIFAEQVTYMNKWLFIGIVALGVGGMLLIATLRIVYDMNLRMLFLICYGIVFLLLIFVQEQFATIAFDSSSVTTGSLSLPFILAFGFGLSAVRSGKNAEERTFGMVGLGSVGPIITVLILGLFLTNASFVATQGTSLSWGSSLLENMRDVAITIVPILIFFFIFQFTSIRLPKQRIVKILVGVVYAYIGIVLFLTGANVGLIPMGNRIGILLAQNAQDWVIVLIGGLVGFCVVIAEPAVIVLNDSIEKITGGAVKRRILTLSLSIGVAIAAALSIIRVLYDINFLYFIIPICVIALILMFFTKDVFVAIAFDSGGVAAGIMTVSFILPFVEGVCNVMGTSVFTGAFGVVSFIASTPILVVEIMGIIYTIASKRHVRKMELVNKKMQEVSDSNNDVVDFRY